MLPGTIPGQLVFRVQIFSISPSHCQHPECGHVSLTQTHTNLSLLGEKNPHCSCLVQIVTVLIHLAALAEIFQSTFCYFPQVISYSQKSTTSVLSACHPLGFLRVFSSYVPFFIFKHICTRLLCLVNNICHFKEFYVEENNLAHAQPTILMNRVSIHHTSKDICRHMYVET